MGIQEIFYAIGVIGAIALLLFQRYFKNRDDPKQQQQRADDRVDRAIAKGEAGLDDVNRLLESGLRDRLRADAAQSGRDPGGQGGSLSQGGGNLHRDQ